MRILYALFLLASLFVIAGCQTSEDNTMVLLDETIKEVNVSTSNGIGDMNQDIIFSFDDKQSIQVFEKAITTAVKQQTNNETKPDYDVMVEYEGGLPTHAIHLWLGDEGEKSTLMYMVGEGETYVTSAKTTDQLREIILSK